MILSQQLGFADDQLRYVLSLFAMYPFAILYALLPNGSTKHLFSIILGVSAAQFVFGSAWIHSFITSAITYSLVRFGPAKYAPYIVFVFNMLYMTASHLYRIYIDYMGWSLDFTGAQMLIVIKLSSFAYNYYDGVVDKNQSTSKVYDIRRKYAINRIPSLLEYFGYVYCFTTFLAGPAFEIREYLQVATTGGATLGRTTSDGRKRAALLKLITGVFFLVIYTLFAKQFPVDNLYSVENAARPFYLRIAYIWMSIFFIRIKYYFAWKVAEGSTVLSGFGFQGYNADGSAKGWHGVSNVDVVAFETAHRGLGIKVRKHGWNDMFTLVLAIH